MSKDFDYYYDRLEVYKGDSIEVADGVESMHCKGIILAKGRVATYSRYYGI
jgi:hypothetical protein